MLKSHWLYDAIHNQRIKQCLSVLFTKAILQTELPQLYGESLFVSRSESKRLWILKKKKKKVNSFL